MRVSNVEYKKSILMIFLLLLCVFQMGILWSEKNPGIPFPFINQLSFWKNNEEHNIDEVKNNYYSANAIILSDGKEDLCWPLEPSHNLYRSIWKDLQNNYLRQIIEKKPELTSGEKLYEHDWYSLIKMKCIIVEFKNPLPKGAIKWLTGAKDASASPLKEIYKIAIVPYESINNTENTLYVYDGVNIYKYLVNIGSGDMKKSDYIKAIETIEDNDNVFPMNRLSSYYPSIKNPELLVRMDYSEKRIWDLLLKTPNEIDFNDENVDMIEEYLREDHRGSMITKFSEDGTNLIFSDEQQVYRYYFNGFFDYQYRNKNNGDKGLVEEALEKALIFIENRRKKLIDGVEIHLNKINEKPYYYEFIFDYVFEGMEVKIQDRRNQNVQSAITICANRDRVVDVKWYIKTFAYNDYYDFYSLNFYDFFEKQLIAEYPEYAIVPVFNDISVIYICPENGMRAEPYWRVDINSKPIYLKMRGKGE
ncbi:MAG: hypothetical protein GX045_03750 [Clostridiaceae bacterium]|jgi:hypothetical protein|nr:hypothetical protein [Clostridiaceae bacterium]